MILKTGTINASIELIGFYFIVPFISWLLCPEIIVLFVIQLGLKCVNKFLFSVFCVRWHDKQIVCLGPTDAPGCPTFRCPGWWHPTCLGLRDHRSFRGRYLCRRLRANSRLVGVFYCFIEIGLDRKMVNSAVLWRGGGGWVDWAITSALRDSGILNT